MEQRNIKPEELYQLIQKGPEFLLFDVRNREDFAKGHIEGTHPFPTLNLPYFEMVERGGKEDFNESILQFLKTELSSQLPKDKKIVVVCNKGRSSALITNLLSDLGYAANSLTGGMQQWAHFYDVKTVVESPELAVYQVIRVSKGCLSYVIVSDGAATVIDPSRNLAVYVDLINKLGVSPQFILDTHAHADHISGGRELAERYGVPYYLHPYDGIHPMDMLPAAFPYEPSWAERTFSLGKAQIKALHVPGHTLGNQVFFLNNRYLFTGDSIFIQSIARPDLGGRAETWTNLHYESLRKLMTLPDSTVVLPAHFSSLREANQDQLFLDTLGALKKKNEGLVMAQKPLEEFRAYILENLPVFPPEYIDIKRVNIGLLHPDEEHAEELEMGKNVCALGNKTDKHSGGSDG